MGNNLFGADIAGIINKTVGPGLLKAALIRVEKREEIGAEILDPKLLDTPVNYGCRAILEKFEFKDVDGEKILENDVKILVIGDSLKSGIIPERGDSFKIEGKTYHVLGILDRDPDAATYVLHARL